MNQLLLALLFAVPAAHAAQAQAPGWDARITEVEGKDAYVFPEGGEEGVPAEAGAPLEPGDRIATGKRSRVEFATDQDSLLEVGPESDFTVEKPEEKAEAKGLFARFSLAAGTLVAKVKKLSAKYRMQVRTPTAVAAVRGTEFGIEVRGDGRTCAGVFGEGRLGVTPEEEGSIETIVEAGQEVDVRPEGKTEFEVRDGKKLLKLRKLKRIKKRLARIKRLLARRALVRKAWVRMGPKKRREFRRKLRERMKGLAPKVRKRIQKLHKKRMKHLKRLNRMRRRVIRKTRRPPRRPQRRTIRRRPPRRRRR